MKFSIKGNRTVFLLLVLATWALAQCLTSEQAKTIQNLQFVQADQTGIFSPDYEVLNEQEEQKHGAEISLKSVPQVPSVPSLSSIEFTAANTVIKYRNTVFSTKTNAHCPTHSGISPPLEFCI